MIFSKRLTEKRLLFIVLMICQSTVLRWIVPYNLWQQVDSVVITYWLLKLLYKEKSQITDVFTFIIASIMMLGVNVIVYFGVLCTIKIFKVYAILSRIVLFIILFLVRDKLYNITKLYNKLWNRDDKVKKKMKTTTFRSLNVVVFNVVFYLVHIILIFEIAKNGGV